MKMNKRLVLVLMLALLIQTTAACGFDANDGTTTTADDSGETTEAEVTTESPTAHIPDNDFEGYEFRMLDIKAPAGWTTISYGDDLWVESENGEIFNDAVWKRNQAVTEKYNFTISLELDEIANVVPRVNRLVAAGDHEYDLVFARLYEAPQLVYNRSLLDLNELPVIDFSKPWWDQNSVKDLSIGGKLYFAAGDMTTMDKDATYCVIYNKKLADNYQVPDLYDLVYNGKWTFDAMSDYMKRATTDLNGDTVIDRNDRFGMLGSHDAIGGLFRSAGGLLADKNKDDMIELSFASERNFTIIDKIFDITYSDDFLNIHLENMTNQEFRDMFAEDKGLFIWNTVEMLAYLRTKDVEFGILPCPKYEETQDRYLNMITVHQTGLMSVPVTEPDLERTGTIIEALTAASDNVQSAYYDVNLNVKGVRDEESVDMLKLIFANRVYDVGDIFFSDISYEFLSIQSTGSRDIASFWAKKEKTVQNKLNKLLKALELE